MSLDDRPEVGLVAVDGAPAAALAENVSGCTRDYGGSLHLAEELPGSQFPCSVVSAANVAPLSDALAAFALAERNIKAAELAGNDIDIPSINELRYFGFHICKAFSCGESEENKQLEEIKKAHKHCKRAAYDAIELGLLEAFEGIRAFKDMFSGKVVISEVVPGFSGKMARADEVSATIQAHQREDRDEYYEECLEHLQELKQILRFLEQSKDDLARKMSEQNRAEERAVEAEDRARKSGRITVIAVIVAAIACVATIGNFTVNAYKAHLGDPQLNRKLYSGAQESSADPVNPLSVTQKAAPSVLITPERDKPSSL